MNRLALLPLSVLCATAFGLRAGDEPAKPEPWYEAQRQPGRMFQELLHLKPAAVDILDLLGKATARATHTQRQEWDFSAAAAEVEELANKLAAGADLTPLSEETLAAAHIEESAPRANSLAHGTEEQRAALAGWMLAKAQEIAPKDPGRATVYARAALLLGATLQFGGRPLGIAEAMVATSELGTLAGVDRDVCARIYGMCKQVDSQYWHERDAQMEAVELMQSMFRSKDPAMPSADVEAAVNALEDWWPRTARSFCSRFLMLQHTWHFLNVARARTDAAAIRQIESLLLKLRQDDNNAHVRRWIDEALQRAAPPIKALFGCGVMLKDGKQIYVDFMTNGRQRRAFAKLDHEPSEEEIEAIRTKLK